MSQTGPGRSYRKGMTLMDLFEMFPDDAAAERWFVQVRWPDGVACPRCGSLDVSEGTKHPTMPFHCRDCRKFFSVKFGTVMHSSKLGYRKWALAIYILTTSIKGTSSMKLHRDIGVTQKTAWHMAHRIRESWASQPNAFAGPVEVDETYIGGKEKNKHRSKRKKSRGRGPVAMTPVLGARDRETKQVAVQVIERPNQPTLQGFVANAAMEGAMVFTDEHAGYRGMMNHVAVPHSLGQYVHGEVHTNGIESLWAMLKRGILGTYHHVSPKHTERYAIEFAGRHNARPKDTIDQMAAIVRGMDGKRLRYDDLIANDIGW